MDEYLRIDWGNDDHSKIDEEQCTFLPDSVLTTCRVYDQINGSLEDKKGPQRKKIKSDYCPGQAYVPKFTRPSILREIEQESSLIALGILQSSKSLSQLTVDENKCLEIYNQVKEKIIDENKRFILFAKKSWDFKTKFPITIKKTFYQYAKKAYDEKFNRYFEYPQFYKELNSFSLIFEESCNTSIDVNFMQNLLEVGSLAKFSPPSFNRKCVLKVLSLPKKEILEFNSQRPVSQDENLLNLVQNHNFKIATTLSALKKIVDTSDLKKKWLLPVKIKNITVKENDKEVVKKVIFIEKPFVPNNPHVLDLLKYSLKRTLKTNLCYFEAFKFENEDLRYEDKKSDILKKLEALEKQMDKQEKNSDSDEEEPDSEPEKSEIKQKIDKGEGKILRNVSYKLWKFKKTLEQETLLKNKEENSEFNVLIRTKINACEIAANGALLPLIIEPKIEQQLEFGSTLPTKSELSKEWASLFFTPFSNLYRARLHQKTCEVVSLEKCSMQKIVSDCANFYNFKPYNGLGVLEKVFEKLDTLEPGNYLLQHMPKHEGFVSILQESTISGPNIFDLHLEYDSCKILKQKSPIWPPLDLNYVLPINSATKRLPGTFYSDDKKRDNMRKATKKKFKKKAKRAAAQQKVEESGESEEEFIF